MFVQPELCQNSIESCLRDFCHRRIVKHSRKLSALTSQLASPCLESKDRSPAVLSSILRRNGSLENVRIKLQLRHFKPQRCGSTLRRSTRNRRFLVYTWGEKTHGHRHCAHRALTFAIQTCVLPDIRSADHLCDIHEERPDL